MHIRSAETDVTVIKKQRRLGRTGRQRRAHRLSLPNLCWNAKYRRKLRSHSKTESNETSDKEIKVTQHEYWALPKMSELWARQLKDPDIMEGRRKTTYRERGVKYKPSHPSLLVVLGGTVPH